MSRAKRQNIAGRKVLCFTVEKAALHEFSWFEKDRSVNVLHYTYLIIIHSKEFVVWQCFVF
jgi:hypothetical protein